MKKLLLILLPILSVALLSDICLNSGSDEVDPIVITVTDTSVDYILVYPTPSEEQ